MELHFCDLCHEAVPLADMKAGLAFVRNDRVICVACNKAMGGEEVAGGLESQKAAQSTAKGAANSKEPVADATGRLTPHRRRPLISSGLGAVLGLAAIVLTLVAVVALLFRIELMSRAWSNTLESERERIGDVEKRQMGTRDGMIASARKIAEDAVYQELGRLEGYERQLAELRQALAMNAGQPVKENGGGEAKEQLLTLGDAMSRVTDLEEQILFLQGRVFELIEEQTAAASEDTPVLERVLLPTGQVGEWVAQLGHPDAIERVSALYALATVEDSGIVRHITPLLEDEDAYIRALSARILERLNARSAVQDLIAVLGDVDVLVREAAVSALRKISGQQFSFDPRGPGNDRYAAVKRWQSWWSENWKAFLYSEE